MIQAPYEGGFNSAPAGLPLGLPEDPEPITPPWGLGSSMGSVGKTPALASVSPSAWDSLKSDAATIWNWIEAGTEAVYNTGKKVITTVYKDIDAGVDEVLDDVAEPVVSTYWYTLLAVVVVAGALYYVGKGGAVSVRI